MKYLQKYCYWVVGTVIFAIVVLYGLQETGTAFPRFCMNDSEIISVHEAEDGNSYVFLPSYAQLEQVTVIADDDQRISVGGISLTDGMNCGNFELDMAYQIKNDGQPAGTLRFCRSANVATMYINTVSGKMKRVHEDKSYEEYASVTVYTADGVLDYFGDNNKIKGRGNSTWMLDKKTYLLTASPEADILGMGAASEWVLLANAADETNLRNKLIFDLAEQVQFEWTPQCTFVDVYLNGNYNGLYLLAEKVEVHSNRLNLNESGGDFLCEIEYNSRQDTLKNLFITQSGRAAGFVSDQAYSYEERNRKITLVNDMEQIILSGDDLNSFVNFDMDSWVRKYLIDEVFDNVDADGASSYFYCFNDVFYGGPIWDYDLTLGAVSNARSATSLLVNQLDTKGNRKSPYYRALCSNESFHRHMVDIYQMEYLPALEEMCARGIAELAEEISGAAAMNSIRWKDLFEANSYWNTSMGQTPEELAHYLNTRIAFLNDIWIDNEEYCSLYFQFAESGNYWNTSVKKGTLLETDDIDLQNTTWICTETGKAFDFSQTIETDMYFRCLSAQQEEAEGSLLSSFHSMATRDIVVIFSIMVLCLLFAVLLVADMKQHPKERRKADEQTDTKISP